MKKHLKFYKACMRTGELPHLGLCNCASRGLINATLLDLLSPTEHDLLRLQMQDESIVYWGSENKINTHWDIAFIAGSDFNTLRQTIVLFMAAINKEL